MIKLEITGNTFRHMYTMGPYYILITNKVSRNCVQMLTRSCADKNIRTDSKTFNWSGVIYFEIKGFQRRTTNP